MLDEYIDSILKQLNIMQYNERAKWIKGNKLDILLTLYDLHTPSNDKVFDLWENQVKEILFLQDLLDGSKINYVVVKTIFLIPYLHSDIDILVNEVEINKVISELRRNGYHVNRVLSGGRTIELRRGDISVELHSDISVLGLFRMTFEQVNEPVEISIDLYNKLLNKVSYWRCPNLLFHYITKLLDILDHKIITIADLLELKVFSDMLDLDNHLFTMNALYRCPKKIALNEIILVGITLSSYKRVIEIKPNILDLIKDIIYYFKIK